MIFCAEASAVIASTAKTAIAINSGKLPGFEHSFELMCIVSPLI
jgi:hypothetical protein